ncbi:hypothetical protein PG996_012267 [Apiospora saccharicola]|uniref:Major facilitator superfamily (MFS) profile domain-containing protein n=1 Tax=Apiospora saccharicola TaxID=335842 RepID=A0ABR1U236_9PEZI
MAVTLASGLFLAGCAMQEIPNLGVFYAGRFLGGLAIGATSILASQYLAENAPKSVRGSLTTSYNLMIVVALALALALALWANYGVSMRPQDPDDHMQWQLALGIQLILGGLLFQAQGPAREPHPTSGANTWKYVRKLTGTDSLNYFAPQIFSMVGVPKGSGSLLTTGVYGIVKVVTTLAYVTVIVDRIGRRLPLIVGALIQGTVMLYLALFIKSAKPQEGGGTSAGGIVGVVW